MQLINPNLISKEIITLLEEANEKAILISPYYKISNWYNLKKKLDLLKQRNIPVEIYIREDQRDGIIEIKEFGFIPSLIPNLHTKLYMNERTAVVSSMNLSQNSESNYLDIAMKTENEKEYQTLFEYYIQHIKKEKSNEFTYPDSNSYWLTDLRNRIEETRQYNAYINLSRNVLYISGHNKYEVFISQTNELVISSILSARELEFGKKNIGLFGVSKMKIDLVDSGSGYYNQVRGVVNDLKSLSITELNKNEQKMTVDCITEFINGVEEYKRTWFLHRRAS